jgi:hypothetical protein
LAKLLTQYEWVFQDQTPEFALSKNGKLGTMFVKLFGTNIFHLTSTTITTIFSLQRVITFYLQIDLTLELKLCENGRKSEVYISGGRGRIHT